VVVAADGKEAVAALERERFDAVLMDVQMPKMKGLEATAVIRAKEKEAGGHVPIMAMTARALEGDRERCMAAGMDAYISKPINTAEFLDLLTKLVPTGPDRVPSSAEQTEGKADCCDAALAQADGDAHLLADLAALFIRDYHRLFGQIREAISAEDPSVVQRAAHTLKGSLGIFAATAAVQIALQLEQMGREGDLANADCACTRLEEEIERILPHLKKLEQAPTGTEHHR